MHKGLPLTTVLFSPSEMSMEKLPASKKTAESKSESKLSDITSFMVYCSPGTTKDLAVKLLVCPVMEILESEPLILSKNSSLLGGQISGTPGRMEVAETRALESGKRAKLVDLPLASVKIKAKTSEYSH